MPVLLVRPDGRAQRVQLVHIRVKARGEGQRVVVQFWEFQTYVNAELAPIHRVGCEVIRSIDAELVNQADHAVWLLAGRVVFVHHFHLQVVVHTETHRRGHTSARVAVRTVGEA